MIRKDRLWVSLIIQNVPLCLVFLSLRMGSHLEMSLFSYKFPRAYTKQHSPSYLPPISLHVLSLSWGTRIPSLSIPRVKDESILSVTWEEGKNKTFSAQLLQLLSFLQCKLQSKQLPGISNDNVLLVCPCQQIITMTLLRTSICCLLPFRPSYAQVPSFFYASLSWICCL